MNFHFRQFSQVFGIKLKFQIVFNLNSKRTVDLHQVSPPRGRLISARLTPADSQGRIPLSVVGTLRKRGDFFWLRLTFQRGMFAGFGGILGEVPLYVVSSSVIILKTLAKSPPKPLLAVNIQHPTHQFSDPPIYLSQ